MKKKLLGVTRRDIQLDFDLYRVKVPIPGVSHGSLSVLDLWPENAQKTIVFLHGYAGVLESWEFQINYFVRQTFRVVAPDLRGHGQSDAPYSDYTMAELVNDLHTVVETLNLPERFLLAGHSFGGSIAVEYAAAHPERLEKLILIATAGEYPLPWFAKLLLRLPLTWFQPLWRFRHRWDAELHVVKRMMANNMAVWKGWEQMRTITTPTLIVTGERDTYFPRWVFEEVYKTIPRAEVQDVGAAKHKVQLERYEAVNRAIWRFVTEDQTQSWRKDAEGLEADLLRSRPWYRSYARDVPQNVPVPNRPLTTFLESAAGWLPNRTATLFYGNQLTYRQLNEQVNRLASILHGRGVEKGDRILLVLPNMPEMVIALFATLKIGAVAVLPNADADRFRVAEQVAETEPRLVITLDTFSPMALTIREKTGLDAFYFVNLRRQTGLIAYRQLRQMMGLGADDESDRQLAASLGPYLDEVLKDVPAVVDPPGVPVAADDLAIINYTSGTTSKPKGVCLNHRNLVANTLQTRHWVPNLKYGRETCLAVVPILHSYGLLSALSVPIALGATIILQPLFELNTVLEAIRDHKVSILPGVPAIYAMINQAPNVREYGLSSIKACISGSEPLPVEVQEAFEKLTQGSLVEGYGLTEASPVTHANPLQGERKAGSIGLPISNTEAMIVDLKTEEPLPDGEIGELWVRGPQVMQGYWTGPGQPFERSKITADGWLKTGDVAVMDGEGYFHLINRRKHLIRVDDDYIFPRDIEEVLYENNKVLEAAVIGLNGSGQNMVIKAFIVPRPGMEISESELVALCKRRLPERSQPAVYEFRESLPRSIVGKLLREKLA